MSNSPERLKNAYDTLQKGLWKEFEEVIKYRPSQYPYIMDKMKPKLHMDAQIFGKPNIIVNTQGLLFGEFINNSLKSYTPQQLIQMAETYSQNTSAQSTVMKKIFDQIEREKNENEYNRTEVQNRTGALNKTLNDF
jgi:hypothetical protein